MRHSWCFGLFIFPNFANTLAKRSSKMKAAIRTKYGSSKVLSIQDVDTPTPKNNEVLIRVHAATANRSDYHVITGRPFFMRLFTGLRKPRVPITGCDFAGEIVATGENVQTLKTGDKVMGFASALGRSTHAQYVALAEKLPIIAMPESLSFEGAAACCEGPLYAACAIYGLNLEPGQNALVYGATGAIGSAYVQYLKFYGVSVTAVCRGEHAELVKSLGASRVIDYTKNDFTKDSERYDFIFDAVGKSSFLTCKRLLKKKGIYTSSNGAINLLWILVTPIFGGKKVVFKVPKNIKNRLSFIKRLVESGDFKPVIDRKYPLDKIADAFEYVATGQKVGNVVITMDN